MNSLEVWVYVYKVGAVSCNKTRYYRRRNSKSLEKLQDKLPAFNTTESRRSLKMRLVKIYSKVKTI